MIKCNVSVCGTVSKAAVVRNGKDGMPDDKMDAKDMKQSASSNDNEHTEVEEEKVARSAFRR